MPNVNLLFPHILQDLNKRENAKNEDKSKSYFVLHGKGCTVCTQFGIVNIIEDLNALKTHEGFEMPLCQNRVYLNINNFVYTVFIYL